MLKRCYLHPLIRAPTEAGWDSDTAGAHRDGGHLCDGQQRFACLSKRCTWIFRVELTSHKACLFGCSRFDFALIMATSIRQVTPSVCCANGTALKVSGHGFYATSFEPAILLVNGTERIKQRALVQPSKAGSADRSFLRRLLICAAWS